MLNNKWTLCVLTLALLPDPHVSPLAVAGEGAGPAVHAGRVPAADGGDRGAVPVLRGGLGARVHGLAADAVGPADLPVALPAHACGL